MILVLIQAVLLAAAGFGLYRLWQAASPSEGWLRLVVATGFLSRAILGQALFWISWGRLPIARALQMGNGLWFFALDAVDCYVPAAVLGARNGLWAIVTLNRTLPSVMYSQTLGVTFWLFGAVTSVAVLLNLFCYLGTIAILVRWSAKEPQARTAAAVAITAVSLSPAFVLWSLQPLKDTFFQFLFVAFVASCAVWRRGRTRAQIATGILLFVLLFALSAIRWYFGFAVLIATALFFLLNALQNAARKTVSITIAFLVAILLTRALVWGAGPYLPAPLVAALNPMKGSRAVTNLPNALVGDIESARSSFEHAGGKTSIIAGSSVSTPAAPARPAPPAPRVTSPPAIRATTPSIQQPKSRAARFLSGAAAVVLPRIVGQWLGLFRVGGGRGLLWFTELDTLVFDVVMLCAVIALARRFTAALRNPLAWLVVAITLLVGLPLAYTVSNFGTLFRLRGMIYAGLLLTPIAVASARREPQSARRSLDPVESGARETVTARTKTSILSGAPAPSPAARNENTGEAPVSH
jgi:hypothetical protein